MSDNTQVPSYGGKNRMLHVLSENHPQLETVCTFDDVQLTCYFYNEEQCSCSWMKHD